MAKTGVWGGRTAEERRAERRDRMIAEAIKIWGEHSWSAVTMRGVCTRSALSDRYFYDEFADLDGLLVAVWRHIRDEVLQSVTDAYTQSVQHTAWEELIRAVMTVFIERIVSESAKTKILLSRNDGSPVLEKERGIAFQQAIELVMTAVRSRLTSVIDEETLRMDTIIGIGGFIELIRAWQSGLLQVDAERIINHVVELTSKLGQN